MSDVLSLTEIELAMRKLAQQVKLDTIEACAKLAEGQYDEAPSGPFWDGGGREVGWHDACNTIADRIRALSSTSQHPASGDRT